MLYISIYVLILSEETVPQVSVANLPEVGHERPGMIVLVPAVLRGDHGVADCKILARQQPSNGGPEFSQCFVVNTGTNFPDGDYVVAFAGHSLRTTRKLGVWLAGTDVTRDPV